MSIVSWFKGKGPSGFGYGSTAEEVSAGLDLSGRTFLVTGSTAGLGLETVRVLALRGARVLATGRTTEKVQGAFGEARDAVIPLACELAEPASVRACVSRVREMGVALDGIVCNAGIMALPRLETAHGYELQFFTNHIGHFILVTGLLEQLADRGRVVVLSSGAHASAPTKGIDFDNLSGQSGYSAIAAYGQSKLANLLFARALARRLEGSRRTANALHPGVIRTKLFRHMGPADLGLALVAPIALKTVAQGAATQVYVATHPSLADVSGEYFADCNLARSTAHGRDPALAEKLWEVSERIVAALPSS
ncbi:MAG: SDR family oxidoreductase [Polyangiaceae bacterium]|nr:SDR family oxidoreductase [Polyangiaceae bacterium]